MHGTQSVYLRTIARLKSGRVRSGSAQEQSLAENYFGAGVDVLGAYLKSSGVPGVLFTSLGIVVATDEESKPWRAVPYRGIERVEIPSSVDNKMLQSHLVLNLHGGEYLDLCVDGGTQTTRDVFEVCRFLMRVTT